MLILLLFLTVYVLNAQSRASIEDVISCGDTVVNFINETSHFYVFVINDSYNVNFDTCHSNMDAVVTVFDDHLNDISHPYCYYGDTCGSCQNDDHYFGFDENFTMPMTAGLYLVYVRAYFDVKVPSSNYTLKINCIALTDSTNKSSSITTTSPISSVTTSTIPPVTTSTIPSVTTSTISPVTTSPISSVTTSTIPSVTTSTTISPVTTSTIPPGITPKNDPTKSALYNELWFWLMLLCGLFIIIIIMLCVYAKNKKDRVEKIDQENSEDRFMEIELPKTHDKEGEDNTEHVAMIEEKEELCDNTDEMEQHVAIRRIEKVKENNITNLKTKIINNKSYARVKTEEDIKVIVNHEDDDDSVNTLITIIEPNVQQPAKHNALCIHEKDMVHLMDDAELSQFNVNTTEHQVVAELEELLTKQMDYIALTRSQLIHLKQQFCCGMITCPQSNSKNANNRSNYSTNNSTSNSSFKTNEHNDDPNKNVKKSNNDDDDKDKEEHKQFNDNNNNWHRACNHLNECEECAYIITQKTEQNKLFKGLVESLQKQHEESTHFMDVICAAIAQSSPKDTKHKKTKLKSNKIIINQLGPSYDPIPSHRAKKNIRVSRKLTTTIIPETIKEQITNVYNFIDKSVGLQYNDNKKINNDEDDSKYNVKIISLDLHHKDTNQALYCKIKPQDNEKNQTYQWVMEDPIFTETELTEFTEISPISSRQRAQFLLEMDDVNKIRLNEDAVKAMIDECKWKQIPIFRQKKNKERITLSITPEKLNEEIVAYAKHMNGNNYNEHLIPIIMFCNDTHWIEHIWPINIVKNNVIGISLRFDQETSKAKITGIHLSRKDIFLQHQGVWPQHMNECKCLEAFVSIIDDINIGNPDYLNNQIKSYKQRYELFKKLSYKLINETEMKGYESIKHEAHVLIRQDNGNLKNNFSECESLQSLSITASQSFSHGLPISHLVSSSTADSSLLSFNNNDSYIDAYN